ncbi:MAG: ATPase [Anaerolineales bacterium]|nr:ATPase [Anaerolineales bacterium]
MRYYLGVDIGGTKSHALVADEHGNALGLGHAGAGNHEVVGYDGLRSVLCAITSQALGNAGVTIEQIAGAGFGVAGYDWPSEREATLEAIGILGLNAPVEAVNDTIIGLLAGAEAGWGIALVGGTSNNCRGWDRQGREGRVLGNGLWFGEYGGAAEILMKAVQEIAKMWTLRGPETALAPAFVQFAGARDVEDFLEGISQEQYELSYGAAPLVFAVAAAGDPVAIDVLRWAGEELGSLVIGVVRQLNLQQEQFDVVLVGSTFKGGALLLDPLQRTVWQEAPGARFVALQAPPVVGAVLLGMRTAGLDTSHIRQRLLESAAILNASNGVALVEES